MKKEMGEYTLQEIGRQHEIWSVVISRVENLYKAASPLFENVERVLFTGCGSNYYMSLGASSLFQMRAGIPSSGVPASELMLFPESVLSRAERTLVIPLCRSGETTEVVEAIKIASEIFGCKTLSIGCFPQSTVAKMCTYAFTFPEAQEKSVVTTKSHTAMLLAVQMLSGLLSKRRMSSSDIFLDDLRSLPGNGGGVIGRLEESIGLIPLDQYSHFVFLGGGPFYGIACEAMLKMKEMALMSSDAFHCLEFRHGPKSILHRGVLVTLFLSDTAKEQEIALMGEVRELGGSVLAVCEVADGAVSKNADYVIQTKSRIDEYARSVLYLPFAQMLAFRKAVSRDIDVDSPRNLTYYVKLEG